MAAPDEGILKAFARFDVDKTGSISRDELADVMKALDASWTDDGIDQLLLQADASGDGQLQLNEFIAWIFAEDAQLRSSQQMGDFTLVVSGCSREDLNGEYAQQKGRAYSRRPVFYCEENGKYLYYRQDKKRQQWQIYSKMSHLSCARLPTKRSAHMPGEGAMWQLWAKKGSGKAKFWNEPSMACALLPAKAAKELPAAEPVPEGWKDPDFPPNLNSIGRKEEVVWMRAWELSQLQTPNGKPVLFGDPAPGDACQGSGVANCWLMGAISGVAEFASFLEEQVFVTKEPSVEGKYEFKLFHGGEWKVICIDDYIPCKPGKGGEAPEPMFAAMREGKMWAILLEKAFAKLWGSYADLEGGSQGYALQALTGTGADNMMRFDVPEGLDVVLPEWSVCAAGGVLVLSAAGGEELGRLGEGAKVQEVAREGAFLKFTKVEGDGPGEGWLQYFASGERLAKRTSNYRWYSYYFDRHGGASREDDDSTWKKLLDYDKNFVIFTAVSRRWDFANIGDGLIDRHSYTLLHAKEACGRRWVAMRNPWGQGEWTGPWNDKDPAWKAQPEVAEALGAELRRDGVFWMEFEDFTWNMGFFGVVLHPMPSQRGTVDEEAEDDEEDSLFM